MGIDAVSRQVIKCDLCDGDPVCVRFCDPGALQFLAASSVNLVKKRDAGLKLSEVMKKSYATRL
jgi:Fe-S-cluster-containing hydrogenase component 2